jgi:hypothetical protein
MTPNGNFNGNMLVRLQNKKHTQKKKKEKKWTEA